MSAARDIITTEPPRERITPDAELPVMGCLLLDARGTEEAARDLDPEDFVRPDIQLIFGAYLHCMAKDHTADPETVSFALQHWGLLDRAGGMAFIYALVRDTPTAANVGAFIRALKEQRASRDLKAVGETVYKSRVDLGAIERARRELDQIAARLRAADGARVPAIAVSMNVDELLATITPEKEVLPGIPAGAYTALAGALSAFKSTTQHYIVILKATGFDLLDLNPSGRGHDTGPAFMLVYEDNLPRWQNRHRRIVQDAHERILTLHGRADARRFLELAAKNVRCMPLAGETASTITCRTDRGLIVPNEEFLERYQREARAFAPDGGLLTTLDPLRLAIVGSQNDDDGADVAVHTLNRMASMLPDSGLLVVSHTTKSDARDPGSSTGGYMAASYATSGSALYSQHARSNFLMVRLSAEAAAAVMPELSPADLALQPIAKLIHGRLSHGQEAGERMVQMRNGVLVPVKQRREMNAAARMLEFGRIVAAAMERLAAGGIRASATALRSDGDVKRYGSQHQVRDLLSMLEENGLLQFEGKTRDRIASLTEKGREVLRHECDTKGRQSPRGGSDS